MKDRQSVKKGKALLSGHQLTDDFKQVNSYAWDHKQPDNIKFAINQRLFSHSLSSGKLFLHNMYRFCNNEVKDLKMNDKFPDMPEILETKKGYPKSKKARYMYYSNKHK